MTMYCAGRKTVVFLPLIKTSQKFRDILNEHGFKAAEVNEESDDRADTLAAFVFTRGGKQDRIKHKMIGLYGLIRAYKHRCANRYETAEYLGVTEEFLQEAIDYYHSKYGMVCRLDNYVVYFEPFGVLEEICHYD